VPFAAALRKHGVQVLLTDYRGYAGNPGSPSEQGLANDARAALSYLQSRADVDRSRIVYFGESLGTGVAVALAAERPVGRMVLESPYTSIADVAAAIYWFMPVRLLINDPFRSDLRIGKVSAPVLVLHGERDDVVPIGFGERLYAMIRAPKRFVRLADAGHNDHDAHGGTEAVRAFLA